MNPTRRPKVIFLHVPKTGGTTFRRVLQRAHPDLAVCSDPSIEVIERMLDRHDAIEILAADAPGGGTMFANRELMQEENWRILRGAEVFVMFRDPVDFVVSLHHHIDRNRETRRVRGTYVNHPGRMAGSIEDFVADPLHGNLQLSFLVGKLPLHSGGLVDRTDLELGIRLLDSVGLHVGVTERFVDFLHLFETVTGATIPGRIVERHNANPNRQPLDPRLRGPISEANALDRALYDHALELVDRQAAALGPPPAYSFTEPPAPATADATDTSRR